jgi:hypothetical protein
MYRKVSVECAPLTPELAQSVCTMRPLPGERALRSSRRNYLEAMLIKNLFNGPEWSVGVCLATGETYRLDGQHSSDLLVNLPEGMPFPEDLLATVTHYEFDSMEDAPDLFNLFNNPKSVRNNTDMMGTYSAQAPGLEGCDYSREFLVDVADGLYESERVSTVEDPPPVKFGARDRGLYFSYKPRPDFIAVTHWLATFRETRNAAFLKRSVIVGDMIGQWRTDQEDANAFWSLVFSEAHPDPDHSSRLLATWLLQQLASAKQPKLHMEAFRKKARQMWKAFHVQEKKVAAA